MGVADSHMTSSAVSGRGECVNRVGPGSAGHYGVGCRCPQSFRPNGLLRSAGVSPPAARSLRDPRTK